MAVTDHGTLISNPSLTGASRGTAPLSLWQLLTLWRTRRQLRALDPAQLRDIGITPDEARTEARRPVWDVPATWRH